MNFFALVSSLLAATCLAADSSNKCVPSKCDHGGGSIGSLQNLTLKRFPTICPSYLQSLKLWDFEMAWAYPIGRVLGESKNMVVQTRVEDGRRHLEVSRGKLLEFLSNLKDSEWDLGLGTIDECVLPKLFNICQLSNEEVDLTAAMSLKALRGLFAKESKHPATMLIVDVAILLWLVDEIRVKPVDQIVDVDQSVLEALCALSMYPEIEELCTDDLFTVLSEVQKLIVLDTKIEYFLSLVNIIKQLDPSPLRQKIEEVALLKFSKIYNFENKKIALFCRILLGGDHGFIKSIDSSIPKADLDSIVSQYRLIADNYAMYSLCNVSDLGPDPEELVFLIKDGLYVSTEVDGDILKWDRVAKPVQSNSIAFLDCTITAVRALEVVIISQLQLPDSVLKQIQSCISWKPLRNFRRLGLTYGMTISKTSCLEVMLLFNPADPDS